MRPITIAEIQRAVAEHFRIPLIEMTSQRRFRGVARPRQIAMYLCRELTPLSLPRIGQQFGDRDHTTIMYGINKVDELAKVDPAVGEAVKLLMARFLEPDQPLLPLSAE